MRLLRLVCAQAVWSSLYHLYVVFRASSGLIYLYNLIRNSSHVRSWCGYVQNRCRRAVADRSKSAGKVSITGAGIGNGWSNNSLPFLHFFHDNLLISGNCISFESFSLSHVEGQSRFVGFERSFLPYIRWFSFSPLAGDNRSATAGPASTERNGQTSVGQRETLRKNKIPAGVLSNEGNHSRLDRLSTCRRATFEIIFTTINFLSLSIFIRFFIFSVSLEYHIIQTLKMNQWLFPKWCEKFTRITIKWHLLLQIIITNFALK